MNLKDYSSIIDTLERGETKKINHDQCPAGTDTKHRLYITRPHATPNIVLAFCHNCQSSGFMKTDNENYRDFDMNRQILPVSAFSFTVPTSIVWDLDEWPIDATKWRLLKGLSVDQCNEVGIGYDPTSNRVYLPMWERINHGHIGNLLGYQLRSISDGDSPKYYTALADKDTSPYTIVGEAFPAPCLGVLVEDLASAIAVQSASSDLDVNVLCNYGTKVTPIILSHLNIRIGLVWLDNDSDHVKEQAITIAKVWNLVSGAHISIVRLEGDPKNMTPAAIYDTLRRHLI